MSGKENFRFSSYCYVISQNVTEIKDMSLILKKKIGNQMQSFQIIEVAYAEVAEQDRRYFTASYYMSER